MNTGLKNKLLVLATAAGLMGVGCGGSSSEPPAAEEGAAAEPTTGAEAPAGDTAAPAGDSAAPAPAAGGEGSCGENSCS